MALLVSNSDALTAFDTEPIAVIDLFPVQRA
jgi:hypothetical protein